MNTPLLARRIVALKPPKPIPALITFARSIVIGMTGNVSFPIPDPTLAAVATAIRDLEVAEIFAQTRTRGAVPARDQKRGVLVILLGHLKAYVQKVVDADREHAPALVESVGMSVKKVGVRAPRVFQATPGSVSGSVKLATPSVARRASYQWEYSRDGGKTWTMAPPTLTTKTHLVGLQRGASYVFRYRAVIKAGPSDWSEAAALLVG